MYMCWNKVIIVCCLMTAVLGALQETHQYIGSNITNSCSDIIFKDGNCTSDLIYVLINKTSPCIFNCTYNIFQNNPHIVRLEVTLRYKHPMKHPTFVSAQQSFYLNSWTLPIMFPVHGDKKEENVSLTVTPVSAWYKLYQWDEEETSVLVTAESSKPSSKYVCGILGLQNAKCPVDTDVSGLRSGRGRYQTFTTRAGMIARKEDFPDGIHVVIFSLPDDGPCSLNIGSESNKTARTKTVVLQLFTHATIWSTWYIFFLTAVVLAMLVSLLTKGALMIIERTLASGDDDDDDEIGSMNSAITDGFKGGSLRVEEAFLIGPASDSNPSRPPNLDTLSSMRMEDMTPEKKQGELGDISEGVFLTSIDLQSCMPTKVWVDAPGPCSVATEDTVADWGVSAKEENGRATSLLVTTPTGANSRAQLTVGQHNNEHSSKRHATAQQTSTAAADDLHQQKARGKHATTATDMPHNNMLHSSNMLQQEQKDAKKHRNDYKTAADIKAAADGTTSKTPQLRW
nr:uncharacterized protein LOC128685232 [Cherax quadricarinatus]